MYANSTNYRVDVQAGVIVDVEATSAHRAYGAGHMLGWLVQEKQITPHVPVWDKAERPPPLLN